MPCHLPLSEDEIWDALEKGHGRAVQHVRAHGDMGMTDVLQQAFLLDCRYDLQVEESRVEWLCGMLAFVQDRQSYESAVCRSLNEAHDPLSWHVPQLAELAARFASEGNDLARAALEGAVERLGVGWQDLLELDGEAALPRIYANWERFDDAFGWNVLDAAADVLGRQAALAALETEAKRSQGAARLLAEVQTRDEKPSKRSDPPDLHAIQRDIETGSGSIPGRYMAFGRKASDADLRTLYQQLLAETRDAQLLRLLWVFRRRRSPGLDEKLFDLANSPDARLRQAARIALSQWQSERIHDFARKTLRAEGSTALLEGTIELFVLNLEPGDAALIEARLNAPSDRDSAHDIGYSLRSLAEANESPELIGLLLWIYENTPCANCRHAAVKQLIRRAALDDDMREECLDDCDSETRAMAADRGDSHE